MQLWVRIMTAKIMCLLVLLFSSTAYAEPIIGPVSKYRDGDTFLIGNQPIRLCGIDAPERDTHAGRQATAYLKRLTQGKALRCVPVNEGTVCDGRSKRTSYDRIVAQCFVQGRDLAEMLVRDRHACDWPRFSGGAYRVVGGCTR